MSFKPKRKIVKPRKLHEATQTRKPAILPTRSDCESGVDWVYENRCRPGEDTGIPNDLTVREVDGQYWSQTPKTPRKFYKITGPPQTRGFPFGKHKGKPLSKIPSHYLEWLINLTNPLEENLLASVKNELIKRSKQKPPKHHTPNNSGIKPPWVD